MEKGENVPVDSDLIAESKNSFEIDSNDEVAIIEEVKEVKVKQFKFQLPDYAKAQEKAVEMDSFLMELRIQFDEKDDIKREKMIIDSNIKTNEQANKMAQKMLDDRKEAEWKVKN